MTEWQGTGERKWRVTPEGIETSDLGLLRTAGPPHTATLIAREYGDLLIDEETLEFMIALIATESRGDATASRFEKRLGIGSYGLCQMLTSTAQWLASQHPRLPQKPGTHSWESWLCQPAVSIAYAYAYLAHRPQYKDPILRYAYYNAGDVYESHQNVWGIRHHGNALDQFARFYGDACHVVSHA